MSSRVGIFGSRDYPNLDAVAEYVYELADDDVIISGGARGVDRTAEECGLVRGLLVVSYRPTETGRGVFIINRYINGVADAMATTRVFSKFATAAFFRNGLIVKDMDRGIAFWDGESHGTKDTIERATAENKPVDIVPCVA